MRQLSARAISGVSKTTTPTMQRTCNQIGMSLLLSPNDDYTDRRVLNGLLSENGHFSAYHLPCK